MPIAIHPNDTREYVLESERGAEKKTTFMLGAIPAWRKIDHEGRLAKSRLLIPIPESQWPKDGDDIPPGLVKGGPGTGLASESAWFKADVDIPAFMAWAEPVLHDSIRGWSGFCRADGSEIKFAMNGSGASKESIDVIGCSLTLNQIIELATAALNYNDLGAERLGN